MFQNSWNLQDAKNHFSKLVEKARAEGPQEVTRRGKHAVVVLSFELYQELVKPKEGLVDFLLSSPLKGCELNIERQRDVPRSLEL